MTQQKARNEKKIIGQFYTVHRRSLGDMKQFHTEYKNIISQIKSKQF